MHVYIHYCNRVGILCPTATLCSGGLQSPGKRERGLEKGFKTTLSLSKRSLLLLCLSGTEAINKTYFTDINNINKYKYICMRVRMCVCTHNPVCSRFVFCCVAWPKTIHHSSCFIFFIIYSVLLLQNERMQVSSQGWIQA